MVTLRGGALTYLSDENNPASYQINKKGKYLIIGFRGEQTLALKVNNITINPTEISTNYLTYGGYNIHLMSYELDLNANDVLSWTSLAMIYLIK